jgi:hypothetical protein
VADRFATYSLRKEWAGWYWAKETPAAGRVCHLTFDMRGAWRPQAGKRPLDGRVRALFRAEPG